MNNFTFSDLIMATKATRDRPIKDYKKFHEKGFGKDIFSPTGSPIKSAESRETNLPSGEPETFTSARLSFETEPDELKEKLKKLRQEQELQRLRQEIEEVERDLGQPKQREHASSSKRGIQDADRHPTQPTQTERDGSKQHKGKIFNLDTLRQDTKLKNKAQKELARLGLFNLDSSEEESAAESELSCELKNTIDNKKERKSDFVCNPQKYPHSYLRFEFVNNCIEFDKLDL